MTVISGGAFLAVGVKEMWLSQLRCIKARLSGVRQHRNGQFTVVAGDEEWDCRIPFLLPEEADDAECSQDSPVLWEFSLEINATAPAGGALEIAITDRRNGFINHGLFETGRGVARFVLPIPWSEDEEPVELVLVCRLRSPSPNEKKQVVYRIDSLCWHARRNVATVANDGSRKEIDFTPFIGQVSEDAEYSPVARRMVCYWFWSAGVPAAVAAAAWVGNWRCYRAQMPLEETPVSGEKLSDRLRVLQTMAEQLRRRHPPVRGDGVRPDQVEAEPSSCGDGGGGWPEEQVAQVESEQWILLEIYYRAALIIRRNLFLMELQAFYWGRQLDATSPEDKEAARAALVLLKKRDAGWQRYWWRCQGETDRLTGLLVRRRPETAVLPVELPPARLLPEIDHVTLLKEMRAYLCQPGDSDGKNDEV